MLTPEASTMIQQMLGLRYVWGGTSMQNGVDCSGFTQLIYGAMGIRLPRVSNDQARAGQAVSLQDAQPGDLVWWDLGSRNDGADHVGIYLGNGKVAEASSSRKQVVIRNLWGNAQFTRLGGGGASPGNTTVTTPSSQTDNRMQGFDMAEMVKTPTKLGQGEDDGRAAFDVSFLHELADEADPGETPETVGAYGVARMVLQQATNLVKQSQKGGGL